MKSIQPSNQNQLQQKDIVDLINWIRHIYGVNIKTILLNYHSETWYKILAELDRVELINGFRNLIELRNKTVAKQVLFFPISAKRFLKLCLKGKVH